MFQRRLLLMAACLLLVAALGSSQANALVDYDTWSGTCSFTVKSTMEDGPPGNKKFVTQSKTKSGMVEMYIGVNGPTPNQEGYYMKFIESGVTTRIGIDDMETIRTEVTKSKSDKVLAIGVGSFFDDSLNPVGLVYLDASGTLKKDNTGQPISLSLTMKLGGTVEGSVWNCAPKVTLTKSPI